jgi:hypothetical protein
MYTKTSLTNQLTKLNDQVRISKNPKATKAALIEKYNLIRARQDALRIIKVQSATYRYVCLR